MIFYPTAVSLQARHGCISVESSVIPIGPACSVLSTAGWAEEGSATNISSLLLPVDAALDFPGTQGVSWEARRSIRLPTAQCVKFLVLRSENEVLEGGGLLLLASEPGCAASMQGWLAEPGQARQMQSRSSLHMTDDLRVFFFPYFTTG